MADITMVKHHDLEIEVVRERLQELADWLKQKYGIRARWQGDSCLLEGSGLKKGVVAISGSEVKVEVTLAMMAKFLKGQVEKEIGKKIDKIIQG
ncbi:MAG: polyhydroxyalkanoic acid system family protein [Deltaproteobacteria bacterium]|nr:polyhydroxyalkanoic acid system family protein [Deltaproteobacteria bacterium]